MYFGNNLQDVQAGTGGTDKGTVEAAAFVPGTLETGKTYYWRVDEFDGTNTYTGEVWCFRTLPAITITDPNLVGWWKLDEGEGTTALDWSGHGYNGTILGGCEWIEGYDGGALNFDGQNDYVDLPIGSLLSSLTNSTFAIWANLSNQAATGRASGISAPAQQLPTCSLHLHGCDWCNAFRHYNWWKCRWD